MTTTMLLGSLLAMVLLYVFPLMALARLWRGVWQGGYAKNKAYPQTRWAKVVFFGSYATMILLLFFPPVLIIAYENLSMFVQDEFVDACRFFLINIAIFAALWTVLPPWQKAHLSHRMGVFVITALQLLACNELLIRFSPY